MNNKGFAITGFIYTILIIFIALLIAILALFNTRKSSLDNLKNKVFGEVNITDVIYDSFTLTGDILEFSAKARGYYEFNVYSPKIGNTNGSSISFEIYLSKGETLYFLIGSSSYNNGITEIRTSKTNTRSAIVKSSYNTSYIADSYNDKFFTNVEVSNNTITDTTGKIDVEYVNKTRKNVDLNKVKYIKDCVTGNSINAEAHWTEIKAIVDSDNKASGKPVIGENVSSLQNITDNSKTTFATSTASGEQCVIVDLERTYNLDSIVIFHKEGAIYYGSKTYVSTDGINYTLIRNYEQKEDSNGLVVSAYEEKKVSKVGNVYVPVKEFDGSVWLRVFHHNNLGGTVLWDSKAQTTTENGYDKLHKQSILYNLNNYKNNNNQFEFLLEYSDISGYNRWIQTSNPVTTSESVSGYKAISISWSNNYWKGLAKSNSGSTFIDGSINHGNWFYAIGAIKVHNGGIPAGNSKSTKEIVDLWVRIDNVN